MARLHFSLVKAALASDHTAVAALTSETFDLAAPLKENGVTNIPTIGGGDTLTVRIGQSLEMAHITAYTSGALTGTWTRGAESSTPTAHSSGDIVRHVITDADLTGGAEALDDLTDVDTTSTPPTDGQALVWDDGSSLWVPGTGAGGGDVATDPIWDAAGDLVYGTGANAAARLPLGAALRVLRVNAGATAPEWVAPSSVFPGAWTSYTPVWTALGTAPSLGNGTLIGAYAQFGKTVFFRMRLVLGTTSTTGTSVWEFTLPVTGRTDFATNYAFALSGGGEDAGVLGYTVTSGTMRGGTKFWIDVPNNPHATIGVSSQIGATTPHAWATGDLISVFGFYEAA